MLMLSKLRLAKVLAVVAVLAACAPATLQPRLSAIDSTEVRASVLAFIQRSAAAAGTLDPVAALSGAPTDSSVIYVSNGHPIRGDEFVAVLGRFYQTLDSLKMVVRDAEIRPLTSDIAAATLWLTITALDKRGRETVDSAIMTAVYERTKTGWRPVLWQKMTLR